MYTHSHANNTGVANTPAHAACSLTAATAAAAAAAAAVNDMQGTHEAGARFPSTKRFPSRL